MKRAKPGRPKLEKPSETAERRQADLLEAGFEEIARSGLEGLRTRDVAARAGVNTATLHYYFKSKEELIEALVQHVGTKFRSPEQPARNSIETLHQHLEGSWAVFEANPGLSVVLQELVVRAQRDEAARRAFRQLFAGWSAHVAEVLRAGKNSGELRSDLDERVDAPVVTSFVMGAMMQLGVDDQAFDFLAMASRLESLLGAAPKSRPSRPRPSIGAAPARAKSRPGKAR